MTADLFARFMTTAGTDSKMAEGLVLAIGDKEGDAAAQAVATFAQGRGFDVTALDVSSARRHFLDAIEKDGDLSDAELEGAAGGFND